MCQEPRIKLGSVMCTQRRRLCYDLRLYDVLHVSNASHFRQAMLFQEDD